METRISFDLNGAIQQWRENLGHSPAFRRESLDELEEHLRDSVAKLQTQGLAADEAFMVAAKRIGKDQALMSEYAKVNSNSIWLDRVLWMLIGIQCWGLAHGAINSLLSNAVSFGLLGYDFSAHGRVFPAALAVLAHLLGFSASLAGCWWLFSRRGSSIGAWLATLMQRRPVWYLAAGGSCAFLLLSVLMNIGTTLLRFKVTSPNRIGEIGIANQFGWIAGSVIQTVTFVALTLLLARRRLNAING
jgi:hypothetical protein